MIWKSLARVPIIHVASMARSGETLLLRCLNSHSDLQVVHNLSQVDKQHEVEFFEFLQDYRPKQISANHPLVKPYCLQRGQRFVLKQAVWKHKYPFQGFVLVRNPIACFASLKVYDCKSNPSRWKEHWHLTQSRIVRWLKKIDPTTLEGFSSLTPISQFARFCNTRMNQLLESGKWVVRYEDFVSQPEATLRSIAAHLKIDFQSSMLASHRSYESGSVGHGDNDLGTPINTDSLFKYMRILSRSEFAELVSLTENVAWRFGYRMEWGSSGVPAQSEYREAS